MEQIDQLIAQVEQSLAQGNVLMAMAGLRRALTLAPGHVYAHCRLADILIHQDQLDEAQSLLETALRLDPKYAPGHIMRARLAMRRGASEDALESLNQAILHDHTAWGARVEKAQLLESLGRGREAALCWQQAASAMPPAIRESAQVKGMVDHARNVVVRNLAELREHLSERLKGLMQGESEAHLVRFRHALDIITGQREFVTAGPIFLPFPRLPAIPYFEREQFDWVPAIESRWREIRAELEAVMAHDEQGFTAYVQTRAGDSSAQFAPLDRNRAWSAYFLWKHGQRIDAHCRACPVTAEAIDAAPQPKIRGRAPAAFFSRLDPGVHIPPHNGATNARLTVHLPLIVPDKCAFRVGDETRQWEEGKLLIFDDTIRHEAWNGSDRRRVVMIFDIWNPFLSTLERELVASTVEGLMEYYGEDADFGEL